MFRLVIALACIVPLTHCKTYGGAAAINPWVFEERLEAFNLLLNGTRLKVFGEDNTGNILWGLPLQFSWQNRSGRLPRDQTGLIDVDDWWADMNYYLSIIPFLAAQEVGLVPVMPIVAPIANRTLFCLTFKGCNEELMKKWQHFFDVVREQQELESVRGVGNMTIEQLQQVLWRAHTDSIRVASPLFAPNVLANALPEQRFGTSWAVFVEFLAAAAFPTDYTTTVSFQPLLPYRVLQANDKPGYIADMDVDSNRALEALDLIIDAQESTHGALLLGWKCAMRTEAGRVEGRYLLSNMIYQPLLAVPGILKLSQDCI